MRARDGLAYDGGRKLDGGLRLQRATKISNGGAHTAENDDFTIAHNATPGKAVVPNLRRGRRA